MNKKILLLVLALIICCAGLLALAFSASSSNPNTRQDTSPELEKISLGSGLPTVLVRKGTKLFRSTNKELLTQTEPPCVTPDGIWSPITFSHSDIKKATDFEATLDLSTPQGILPCYVDITAIGTYPDLGEQRGIPIRLHVTAPTPTPTPTPIPCHISAPLTLVVPRRSSRSITVSLNDMSAPVTVTTSVSSGQVGVLPISRTTTGTSALLGFLISNKQNGGIVTFRSECGNAAVNVTPQ